MTSHSHLVFSRRAVTCLFLLPFSFLIQNAPAQIQQAWVARYNNGILNGTNQAVKMVLDSNGNVYVTGSSQNANTNLGYVTIKYAPNGTQIWAARCDDTNYPTAAPSALVLDTSNNAIVTGTAVTVKYDTNGNQLWTAPYAGASLAVDTKGNVAVTGFNAIFGSVKLNPSGINLWQEIDPSSCGGATGQLIVADTNGSFYVAGNYPFYCEGGLSNFELLLVKYGSDGNEVWTTSYSFGSGPPWQSEGAALQGGNLYVAGNFVGGDASRGYVVFVYDVNGGLVWSAVPDIYISSMDRSLVIDHSGRAVVIGQIPTDFTPDDSPLYSYGTMKLGTNGSTLWSSFYPATATFSASANGVSIDGIDNVYVTGYSPGTNGTNDIVTIKYDPNGNQVWLQRYSSPSGGNAAGNAIAVDNNGNVYVTGYDTTAQGGTEIVTIKYSPVTLQRRSDGTVILQAQGSPGEAFDIEASTNLLDWLDLGAIQADTNGLLQFEDTNAPAFPARFYHTTPQ